MSYKSNFLDYNDVPLKIEKYNILGFAEARIKKELEKINKKIESKSKKLTVNNDVNDSKRDKLAVSLNVECMERDKWQKRLDILQEWKEDVFHEKA